MSSSANISPSFLQKKRDTSAFLNSRRNLTGTLGKDNSYESEFIKADDNPNRSHKAFRGIGFLNPSPFKTGPLKDYRGIVKTKYDGFTNPDGYVNDSAMGNRYQGEPDDALVNSDNADKMDYGRVGDSVYLNQHPDSAKLIDSNSELRGQFDDDTLDSDYDLSKKITGIAEQRLDSSSPLSAEYLGRNPDEAKLIALNAGGAADVMNKNPEVAENLTGQTRDKYSDKIRSEMAEKVSAQLDPETGLDEEFFKDNPEAASYLNSRPGEIEKFNQRTTEAKNFKQHYGAFKETQETETLDKAKNALNGQGGSLDSFLESDSDLAADVVVDDALKQDSSLADNIIRNDTMNDNSHDVNDTYDDHIAELASKAVGNSTAFNKDYLKSHPELGMTIHASPELAAGLRNDVVNLDRFFGSANGSSNLKRNVSGAMQAFSSGYPLRNAGFVDMWT